MFTQEVLDLKVAAFEVFLSRSQKRILFHVLWLLENSEKGHAFVKVGHLSKDLDLTRETVSRAFATFADAEIIDWLPGSGHMAESVVRFRRGGAL